MAVRDLAISHAVIRRAAALAHDAGLSAAELVPNQFGFAKPAMVRNNVC